MKTLFKTLIPIRSIKDLLKLKLTDQIKCKIIKKRVKKETIIKNFCKDSNIPQFSR